MLLNEVEVHRVRCGSPLLPSPEPPLSKSQVYHSITFSEKDLANGVFCNISIVNTTIVLVEMKDKFHKSEGAVQWELVISRFLCGNSSFQSSKENYWGQHRL